MASVSVSGDTLTFTSTVTDATDTLQFNLVSVTADASNTIGGGLEIAVATHVRIAEPTVRFQLPEGRLGIFVGGGATVRVGRIIGADRMREMMLTGRRFGAEEGLALGLAWRAALTPASLLNVRSQAGAGQQNEERGPRETA